MNQQLLAEITQSQIKPNRDHFKVGDGVKVHTIVREGDKTRTQIFRGIVIALKGAGIHKYFTVRNISHGEGVERVFPVNSVNIEKIEVDRESIVMRSRIHYLRDRVGRASNKVKEKRLLEYIATPPATAKA